MCYEAILKYNVNNYNQFIIILITDNKFVINEKE